MKKILVPTDFSPLADQAIKVAVEISRKTKAEIELLHVIDAPFEADFSSMGEMKGHDGMNDVFILQSIERAKKKLHEIRERVEFVGARFISRIKLGDPSEQFTKVILEKGIDFIVMGTKGTTGSLKGIFNNSNTEEVVVHANCMVLTVKEENKDFHLRNVVFATNFKDDAPVFVENIKYLQEIFDFRLHLVYVNSVMAGKVNPATILQKMEEFVKFYQIKNYEQHILEDFTEYTGLTEYAETHKADIIALTTHQRKGLGHWLGGLSEDLVNFSHTPVLTYKAE